MLKLLVVLSLALAIRGAPQVEPREDPIVNAPIGILRGVAKGYSLIGSDKYFAFKGIPYAEPPVGDFRFRAPRPHQGWVGIRDAQEHGSICVQGSASSVSGAEDCLFLNVYTPSLSGKRPVMVWIHGGSFTGGSGNSLSYGPEFFLKQDVVTVTINYRLGILGFMSTGDSYSPGNYGLKDMQEALRWVKRNIAAFTGDPDNVTIFGESAGGSAIHYLVLSPQSTGLFNRAIAESGTALCPWAFQADPRSMVVAAAKDLGIDTSSSEAIVRGFRAASLSEIQGQVHGWGSLQVPRGFDSFDFAPCVDAPDSLELRVIPRPPTEIMKSGTFQKVPFIIGMNSDESLFMAREGLIVDSESIAKMNANPGAWPRHDWNVPPGSPQSQEIIQAYRDAYFEGGDIVDTYDYVKFMTDNHFTWPVYHTVELHAAASSQPVYFYIFSYDGAFNYIKRVLLLGHYPGAMHADEVPYIWSISTVPDPVLPGNHAYTVRNRMLRMWTDFAKVNNPTPTVDSLIKVQWPRVGSNQEHIRIDEETTSETRPFEDRMKWWREFDSKYGP